MNDLLHDLRDGLLLASLVEMFTGESVKRLQKPTRGQIQVCGFTFHPLLTAKMVENCNACLAVLKKRDVAIPFVSAEGECDSGCMALTITEIVNGSAKMTLTLVWSLIKAVQLKETPLATKETDADLKTEVLHFISDVSP